MDSPDRSHEYLSRINELQVEAESDPFTPQRYTQFASFIRPGESVLDFGCNTGRGGRALRDALPDITLFGLEMLAGRVDRVPSGVYDRIFTTDVRDLATDPESLRFDAIVMGEVIEHIPLDQIDGVLAAIRSCLKPRGRLILTTPNPHYFLLGRRSRGSVLGGAHVSVHCPQALSQYLEFRSFKVDRVQGTGRISTYIGSRFPLRLYGAFLIVASVDATRGE